MNATKINIQFTKTYATKENAEKAIAKVLGNSDASKLRYIIARTDDDRYSPVFVGESAISAGMHFHFNVIG